MVGLGGKVYITDDIDGFWETRTETWRQSNASVHIPTLGRSCSRNVCFCGVCDVVRTFTPW